MSKIIGIDLGTTHSVAATMTDEGPRVIPNALGEALTPSVVGIDLDGKLVVGRAALELQVLHPDRCGALFKRHMGMDWSVQLAGRKFTPEELSSLVLRSLKEDAEAHFGEPVTQAVITVPAYFNDQQRQATLNAGRIAGFTVERIFNEPTSAALAYGFHEAREDKTLLIFDLGGGTFDVSVVELFDGVLEVKASSGETFLGGEDFTRTLAARILEKQGMLFEKAELDSPLLVSRLIQQAEIAKRRLSHAENATLRVPDRKGDFHADSPEISVARADFQRWTEHILARVEMPMRRVLGDAGVSRERIDEVIFVGGATRMPAVLELATRWFGKKPHCRINPDEVVGLGAAVQAGLVGRHDRVRDLVITDVAPFTLGIAISKRFGTENRDGYFLPVIHRNTTIPVSRVEPVATVMPNQTEVVVCIYQGEGRRIEQNLYLGEFIVKGIPSGPAGQAVEIRFTYDLNGILEVEATIVATRQKVSHVVTQHARGMTPKQLEQAVKDMAKFKTHPREESGNRLILRRAERIYKELPQFLRDELSALLDGFEAALSMQDPAVIDNHRQALEMFLSRFDSTGTEDDRDD